jgi:glycosyltransferase involved in cell wall biosynthesis
MDLAMPKLETPKIAILGTRGIPAKYGGFETFAEALAIGLSRKGCDVTVFCERGDETPPATYQGVKLVHLRAPRLGPLSTIIFDLKCLLAASRGYDVVYMLGYGAAPFCLIPRLFGRHVWINMDGVEWKRSKWSWAGRLYLRTMERIAVRVAGRVIADAAAIKDHLESRYGRLDKCDVIAYGAHVTREADAAGVERCAGVGPGGYYLVVCRLEPENHVREIIAGFEASGSPHPLVVVGGTAEPTNYVRGLLQRQGDRVRFVGAIYDQNLLGALRFHARAYIHGHSVGGTNPSLLEAMGVGNLVIAHDNPFNREVLGPDGRYFADPGQLAENIRQVDELGTAERLEIAERMRGRIADCYGWEQIVDQYWTLVQKDNHSA